MSSDRWPVPAAASLAIADVLTGPPQPGRALGMFSTAIHLAVAGTVVAVVSRDGMRLPNALIVSAGAMADLQSVANDAATLGGGRLRMGCAEVRAVRWWDPAPRLGRVAPGALKAATERLARLVPARPQPACARLDVACGRLADALDRGDPSAAAAAAGGLVGLGPGLTPAGDDVLAGVLAALRLLPEALAAPPHPLTDTLAAATLHRARERTPALSAALLGHAALGQVPTPAGRLLRALTDNDDLEAAARGLMAVGHTSGRELTYGIALGARAVIRNAVTATVITAARRADPPCAICAAGKESAR